MMSVCISTLSNIGKLLSKGKNILFFMIFGMLLAFTQQAQAQDCTVWQSRDELPFDRFGCANPTYTFTINIVRAVNKTVNISDITIGMH